MSEQYLKLLISALNTLKENGPIKTKFGLCYQIDDIGRDSMLPDQFDDYLGMAHQFIRTTAMTWPEYSGDSLYPVRHPNYQQPMHGYLSAENVWEGEYGQSRWRLVDYLIECAQQQLASV